MLAILECFLWFAGYFAVSGATTTFTAHVYCRGNLWSTPAPTFAGLFWPVALPMLGAIAFTTAVVHSPPSARFCPSRE